MESAPTNGGKARGQPGKRGPGNAANPPFLNSPRCGGRERPPYGTGKTWRPTGKMWRCKVPREGRGPPLQTMADVQPTGKAQPCVNTNLCRGRCSHRPGSLAPPRTPAGGINPAPTNRGKARGQPGKREPGNAANPCRDRFHIGPVCGGAGFRGRDLRPKSRRCAAVGLRNAPAGGINPAPTNKFYVLGQPGQPRPPGWM